VLPGRKWKLRPSFHLRNSDYRRRGGGGGVPRVCWGRGAVRRGGGVGGGGGGGGGGGVTGLCAAVDDFRRGAGLVAMQKCSYEQV